MQTLREIFGKVDSKKISKIKLNPRDVNRTYQVRGAIYEYKGQKYSLSELAEISGLPRQLLYDRIVKWRWNVYRAISSTPKTQSLSIEYKGKKQSLYRWSKELGIKYRTLLARIHKQWDADTIFAVPLKTGRPKYYQYKGKSYRIQELSRISGVCENTLRDRLNRLKWSVEKAVETPARGNKNAKV